MSETPDSNATDHSPLSPTDEAPTTRTDVTDLDAIERDLADVETALRRLDDGTYWSDEVSGEPIADAVLADNPVSRLAT